MTKPLSILIPTDFSDNAFAAAAFVFNNFEQEKIDITIIHTIEQPNSTANVMMKLEGVMQKDAENDMALFLQKLADYFPAHPAPKTILRHGYLKDWVSSYAAASGVELIVMGTKGESNVASKMFGSVTESILRTSKIPMLSIPRKHDISKLHSLVIATKLLEFENAEFIERFLSASKWYAPKMEILVIRKSNNEDISPKMVTVGSTNFEIVVRDHDKVADGINEYIEENTVSILGLYHKNNSRFDYFFNNSITKNICGNTDTPLLSMPGKK